MARAVASLLVLFPVSACGGADAPPDAVAPSSPARPESHQRMVALLAEAAKQAAVDNPFFGEQRLARLRAELARLGDAAP
jgi:hypothetical protein